MSHIYAIISITIFRDDPDLARKCWLYPDMTETLLTMMLIHIHIKPNVVYDCMVILASFFASQQCFHTVLAAMWNV